MSRDGARGFSTIAKDADEVVVAVECMVLSFKENDTSSTVAADVDLDEVNVWISFDKVGNPVVKITT